MKISELLTEADMPESLKDMPVITFGDHKLTAGDVADVLPGVEPEDVIEQGKHLRDFLSTKIKGDYTRADALIDIATFYPAFRISKWALAARGGAGAVGKEVAKGALRREVGQQVQQRAEILPSVKDSKKSGAGGVSPIATKITSPSRKRKYKVGDQVSVEVKGRQEVGVVSNVLPKGYEVDISHVKDAPSKSVNIPEPMFEEASAGATSAGNIASTGNSPHIAAGTPAVLKRWSGEPGKMGKSIKPPKSEPQDSDDNPVTNPKVGNNLIS